MPWRLDEHRAKISFVTAASMPYLIYQACLETGCISNTVYIQHALVEALARDLGLDVYELMQELPKPRGPAKALFDPTADRHPMDRSSESFSIPVADTSRTVEEVR